MAARRVLEEDVFTARHGEHALRQMARPSGRDNVLGSITSAVAGFGLNISDLVNRSRGAMAVSVVDMDEVPARAREALCDKVAGIPGMKRVRLLGV